MISTESDWFHRLALVLGGLLGAAGVAAAAAAIIAGWLIVALAGLLRRSA